MLHVMQERADVLGSVSTPQRSLPMTPICFPHPNVAFSSLQKCRTFTMTLTLKPLAFVQVSIVKVASAGAVAEVVSPSALVFVIPRVVAIFCYKPSITFP